MYNLSCRHHHKNGGLKEVERGRRLSKESEYIGSGRRRRSKSTSATSQTADCSGAGALTQGLVSVFTICTFFIDGGEWAWRSLVPRASDHTFAQFQPLAHDRRFTVTSVNKRVRAGKLAYSHSPHHHSDRGVMSRAQIGPAGSPLVRIPINPDTQHRQSITYLTDPTA